VLEPAAEDGRTTGGGGVAFTRRRERCGVYATASARKPSASRRNKTHSLSDLAPSLS
jgi:hypothetical protein